MSIFKSGLLLITLFASQDIYAACTEQNVPLGSGTVSTGTQISKSVTNQNANGSGDGDGTFTYHFNLAQCGRHADGTWWLAPISSQSKVTISDITSNSVIKAEANPDPAARGFLNNAEDYGYYDASKNIIAKLPLDYPLNSDRATSIFSVIQRQAGCGTAANSNECIEFADFLTVYQSPPINGGKNTIRPSLFGSTKQIYTWANFDRSRIPSIEGADWNYDNDDVLRLISKWTATTEGFSIPICDANRANCSFVSEGGRAFRSHAVIDDYATGGQQNRVLSYLFSNNSDAVNDTEDRALLAAVIAYGIDIITLISNPPSSETYGFGSGAGQFMNAANFSYLTAALSPRSGSMWNTMSVDVKALLASPSVSAPQEIQQIYDSGHGPVWGDGNPNFDDFGRRRYWTELTNGLTHDNNFWYEFTTPHDGSRFLIQDEGTDLIAPPSCNYGNDANSVCPESTVLVNGVLMGVFDWEPDGSYIRFTDPIPAGTKIEVSPILESFQGSRGGNRASADPHGYIDGPPNVPGFGYFQVSNGPRFELAAMAQAMPELCEVINSPNLIEFVERYFESGLQMGNDPCAPPSVEDVNSGTCDVWRTRGCLDYGLSNNGTVRWGPDPRDNTQCAHNNRLLTQQNNGNWVESVENRGDKGRFSRFDGAKNNGLPTTFTNQYIAFKGNRDCLELLSNESPEQPRSDANEQFCVPIATQQGKVSLVCL